MDETPGIIDAPVTETLPEETPSINVIDLPPIDPKVAQLEANNRQLFERAKKAEAEAKENRTLAENARNAATKSLDVEDYIDISTSLEGLDQREKSYLAEQHKLTGKPLAEIRKDENFQLWQSAYQSKVEKEKLTLKPSNTQSESDAPMSFEERLQKAGSMAEKEKLLSEAGLYKEPRPRPDRTNIGNLR